MPEKSCPESCSWLLQGAWVVTMDEKYQVFAPGALAVKGDRLVAVGPPDDLRRRFAPERLLDFPQGLILPGLINAHTHAAMSLFRGLADDLPLEDWLTQHIFPAEQHLSHDFVYWGTRLAIAEMLLSGTTTFCDMYLFADAVAQAVADSGIRALVGEVLYDFPSPNYGSPENGLKFTEELIQHYQGHPRVRVAVQPHAVYTCSPPLLTASKALADRHNCRWIIHLSETAREVADCLAEYGATPVGHLHRLGLLAANTVADHAVVLTDGDIDLLASSGVGVAHCPESNMKLASGMAPVAELLARGVPLGLGTDGCASNNNLDLLGEMDTAAKLAKVRDLDPTALPARETVALATCGGARILGWEGEIGRLAPGFKADVVVIDLDQPHLTPIYDPYSQVVYAATGGDVLTVMVDGRLLVENRRLLAFDLEETLSRAREVAKKVKENSA